VNKSKKSLQNFAERLNTAFLAPLRRGTALKRQFHAIGYHNAFIISNLTDCSTRDFPEQKGRQTSQNHPIAPETAWRFSHFSLLSAGL